MSDEEFKDDFVFESRIEFRTWKGQEKAIDNAIEQLRVDEPEMYYDKSKFIRGCVARELQRRNYPTSLE